MPSFTANSEKQQIWIRLEEQIRQTSEQHGYFLKKKTTEGVIGMGKVNGKLKSSCLV